MNERTLDHVGIAVSSLDDAIPVWTGIVGAAAVGRETVASQGVEIVFLGTGQGRVELLAPTRPDSPVGRFLERRGPGIHHLAYRVTDIHSELKELEAAGFEPIDREPREGAHHHLVAFLHPRTAGGVLVELVEHRSGAD
ncbi:MAG TPA: methylmalonyl-CoA epimerase [Longimicrobiaceae bacterium]|nr:methylmalonyl-CoA epimerase [Longimicrobiaceae bacterium]